MIIIGYPGIGKSTLSKKDKKYVDLDSSLFWKHENGIPVKKPDWIFYYSKVAESLSQQGYIVFVCSRKEVRDYLKTYTSEKICSIYPSVVLKDEWIKKLEERYNNSELDKDLRALNHVKSSFIEDIKSMDYENSYNEKYIRNSIKITDMSYDLQEFVNILERI